MHMFLDFFFKERDSILTSEPHQGKLESETMGWEESIVIMETMDEVRRQGGVVYPEKIETTEYPVAL